MYVILCLKGEELYLHKHCDCRLASKPEIANWLSKGISIVNRYACLDLGEVQGLQEIKAESYSYFNGQLHGNRIWTG